MHLQLGLVIVFNVKPVNLCRKNSTSCLNSSGGKGGGDLDSSITHLAHKLAEVDRPPCKAMNQFNISGQEILHFESMIVSLYSSSKIERIFISYWYNCCCALNRISANLCEYASLIPRSPSLLIVSWGV